MNNGAINLLTLRDHLRGLENDGACRETATEARQRIDAELDAGFVCTTLKPLMELLGEQAVSLLTETDELAANQREARTWKK